MADESAAHSVRKAEVNAVEKCGDFYCKLFNENTKFVDDLIRF